MQASYLQDARGTLEGSMGSRASQSPDGFCKGLSHAGLSPAGATLQGSLKHLPLEPKSDADSKTVKNCHFAHFAYTMGAMTSRT